MKECFAAQLSYLGCVDGHLAIVILFAQTAVKVVIIVKAKQFIRLSLKKKIHCHDTRHFTSEQDLNNEVE